jgi:hypothetical protein
MQQPLCTQCMSVQQFGDLGRGKARGKLYKLPLSHGMVVGSQVTVTYQDRTSLRTRHHHIALLVLKCAGPVHKAVEEERCQSECKLLDSHAMKVM